MSFITGAELRPERLHLRLRPPAEPSGLLPRRAMLPDPATLAAVKLVLFRAPSGYGKTVAMGQMRRHLAAQGTATAWITLNSDTTPEALQQLLSLALDQLTTEPKDDAAGESLSTRLATLAVPFALFIDEAEALQTEGGPDLLRDLLDALPDGGLLVLGSQRIPQQIGLSRYRLRGQLLEFRPTELRFSAEETREFLTDIARLNIDRESLARLHRKTEGWPAALRMASAALQTAPSIPDFVARFDGSDLAVGDYLAEEVLAKLPEELSRFLLATSILRELTPPLCEALCPGINAREALEALSRSNMLITRSDESDGEAWRCHGLLSGHLQARLQRSQPAGLPALHARAAAWYEAEAQVIPAISHYLRGGDPLRAIPLLRRHGHRLLQDVQLRILNDWFAQIPASLLALNPDLLLLQAWATCLTKGPSEARPILTDPAVQLSTDPVLRAEAACLLPMLRAMEDDFTGAEEAGLLAEAQLDLASDYSRAMTRILMSNIRATLDPGRAAAQADTPLRDSEPFTVIYGESVQAFRDLQENRFRLARARLQIAATTRPDARRQGLSGNVWAGIPWALTLYETGDLSGAAPLLRRHLPIAMSAGLIDHVILAGSHLARIAFATGEVDEAFSELLRLERYGLSRDLPRVVAGAGLARARLWLAQGNLRAASDQLHRLQPQSLWARIEPLRLMANDLETASLGQIRLHLHRGEAVEALALIRPEAARARRSHRHRRALLLQLLEAAALARQSRQAESFARLAPALRSAAREGYHQLLLDEGPPLTSLLTPFARSAAAAGEPPAFRQWLTGLTAALSATDEPGGAAQGAPEGEDDMLLRPLDALTAKELQVLHLLAEGYSNAAMSEKLLVSDSTVRTHLRNINSKLAAPSRARAVAVARRMRLIP